jgi:hypothetical protein
VTRCTRALALLALLVALLASTACPPVKTVHVPGKTKSLDLVVKLAALDDASIASIGSFSLTLAHDGTALAPIPLNFSASDKTLTFLDDTAASNLPTSGKLSATLQANDLTGASLPIGGATSTPLDLDAVPRGGSASLFMIVGKLGAATPLDIALSSTPLIAATVAGTSLIVVDGDVLESFDLATGKHLTAASATVAISLDQFASTCPHAGQALLENANGALASFDPKAADANNALTPLGVTLSSPHTDGVAFATSDCRVFFAGGSNQIDVVDLSGTPSVSSSTGVDVATPALVDLGDALAEHVLVGGQTSATPPAAVATATLVTPSTSGATVCSSDAACNGSAPPMKCARDTPTAARIDDGTDAAPTLIAGGSNCNGAVEMMALTSQQFLGFFSVDNATPTGTHGAGAALASLGKNTAVLVGGGTSTDVDLFTFANIDFSGGVAHGSWTTATTPLVEATGNTKLFSLGGAVVVLGSASQKVSVIVPALDGGGP